MNIFLNLLYFYLRNMYIMRTNLFLRSACRSLFVRRRRWLLRDWCKSCINIDVCVRARTETRLRVSANIKIVANGFSFWIFFLRFFLLLLLQNKRAAKWTTDTLYEWIRKNYEGLFEVDWKNLKRFFSIFEFNLPDFQSSKTFHIFSTSTCQA